jgi:acetyltransferase-like isoleucine patch superfamily enzyme
MKCVSTGSVVAKDVPPLAIVAGKQMKVIGTRKNELKYTFNNIQVL